MEEEVGAGGGLHQDPRGDVYAAGPRGSGPPRAVPKLAQILRGLRQSRSACASVSVAFLGVKVRILSLFDVCVVPPSRLRAKKTVLTLAHAQSHFRCKSTFVVFCL